MTKMFRNIGVLVVATLFVSGCSAIEEVYAWKREDGDIFEMRIRLDEGRQRVILLEKYIPKDKTDAKFFINDKNYMSSCSIVNKANWTCQPTQVPYVGVSEKITMTDGQLFYSYWNENRQYKRSYKFIW